MTSVTCFHWACNHGYDGDEDGGNDVEDGPDEVDLDGSVPFRVFPSQPRKTEHSQANAHLI